MRLGNELPSSVQSETPGVLLLEVHLGVSFRQNQMSVAEERGEKVV